MWFRFPRTGNRNWELVALQQRVRRNQRLKFTQDLRPSAFASCASRHRWIVKQSQRPLSRSLSTRFSSWRYSITSQQGDLAFSEHTTSPA